MAIAETTLPPTSRKPTKVFCDHCQLPVPAGFVEKDAERQFCCYGCRTAFELIHDNGLDAFYAMAAANLVQKSLSVRQTKSEQRFLELDQPSLLEKFGKQISQDVSQITLLLDGIHCAACIWLIEKVPQILPGVIQANVNWSRRTVTINWRKQDVLLSQIAACLHRLGYTPHPLRENENLNLRRNENRRHLIRIGIAGAAAGNNMLIALALYLGMFNYMAVSMQQTLRIASCIVGLVSLLWPGRVFFIGALSAIKTKTPHMDLPIALGLSVGGFVGAINTVLGIGEIYFDSLSVLVFLLFIGRWIQFRQQSQAADSIEMLYRLTPKTTQKFINNQLVEVSVDSVEDGDRLEIRAGDLFPVDAVVVAGSTDVDESILSGESRPKRKNVGDAVLAGTKNLSAVVNVRASATGRSTRLSKIVDLVEQAANDKPQIVQWANRIGGYFVVAVIGLATLTFATWATSDLLVAVDRTVALLIVACPCALALATPLAISVTLGRAAKQKIMIKHGDTLQRIGKPGMIWLDKTGTLTQGQLEVVQWHGDTRWQPLIAAIESKSAHPVAQAIAGHVFGSRSQQQLTGEAKCQEYFGQGLECDLPTKNILVGNLSLMESHQVAVADRHLRINDNILRSGLSPCWAAVNGAVVAIIGIGDRLRPDALDSVGELKSQGWEVGILSGDHPHIVRQVAARLGIEEKFTIGGATPEYKVEIVKQSLQQFDTVLMVGDGVNDSAALATASVGIAVHGGAEASLAAAPVYLAESGLRPILHLMQLSRWNHRTMKKNLAISLIYNLTGATLAFLGFINPLVAAILMPISSLSVVAMSLSSGTRLPWRAVS